LDTKPEMITAVLYLWPANKSALSTSKLVYDHILE
jgi:hypothetical protein